MLARQIFCRSAVAKICNPALSMMFFQRLRSESTDEPVKFSTSQASSWKAQYSRQGNSDTKVPWFQPLVVVSSVAIFLVYFCILREESDIDEGLGTSLYDRIDGLEEAQLKLVLEYNLKHNKDTEEIIARLNSIKAEKSVSNS